MTLSRRRLVPRGRAVGDPVAVDARPAGQPDRSDLPQPRPARPRGARPARGARHRRLQGRRHQPHAGHRPRRAAPLRCRQLLEALVRHRRRAGPLRWGAGPAGRRRRRGRHRHRLARDQPGGEAHRRAGPARSGDDLVADRIVRMPTSRSFPSGHTASAFAFAGAVSNTIPPLSFPLTLMATAVGYSRVHTGVHFPADVLFGSVIGATTGETASWGLTHWRRRRGDRVAARHQLTPERAGCRAGFRWVRRRAGRSRGRWRGGPAARRRGPGAARRR